MPTSLMKAVPPGKICSSAVGTCVCVPSTAVTRPLRWWPIKYLSAGGFGVHIHDDAPDVAPPALPARDRRPETDNRPAA